MLYTLLCLKKNIEKKCDKHYKIKINYLYSIKLKCDYSERIVVAISF